MIKLNDDNIFVGEIKQLLKSFNLPKCRVYASAEDLRFNGEIAIVGNDIVQKTSSGTRRLDSYQKGNFIANITTNLSTNTTVYDYHTHEYLGEYLRFLRDYTGVNLMGMYNCFSYETTKNVDVEIDGVEFKSNDGNYTLFSFPVKFGQKYSIALTFHGEICAFYGIASTDGKVDVVSQSCIHLRGMTFEQPRELEVALSESMEQSKKEEYFKRESGLRMFVKVPKACESSIVVLEGEYDYLQLLVDGYKEVLTKPVFLKISASDLPNIVVITSQEIIDNHIPVGPGVIAPTDATKYVESKYPGFVMQRYGYGYDETTNTITFVNVRWKSSDVDYTLSQYDYLNKHQLLDLNLNDNQLLADRLVEYLSNQAITPNDEIVKNIKRLQKTLLSNEKYHYSIENYYGMWDDGIRRSIYRFVVETAINDDNFDVISYCDKDVENAMGYLKEIYADGNGHILD